MSGLLEQLEARIAELESRVADLSRTSPIPKDGRVWVTVLKYCELHGVGETMVRAAVKAGRLPSMRIGKGRSYRVDRDHVLGRPMRAKRIAVDTAESVSDTAARLVEKAVRR